jgi:hypothetical protein
LAGNAAADWDISSDGLATGVVAVGVVAVGVGLLAGDVAVAVGLAAGDVSVGTINGGGTLPADRLVALLLNGLVDMPVLIEL